MHKIFLEFYVESKNAIKTRYAIWNEFFMAEPLDFS